MVVPPEGMVTVWIDRSWLQGLTMRVTPVPEPESTSVHVLDSERNSSPGRPRRD